MRRRAGYREDRTIGASDVAGEHRGHARIALRPPANPLPLSFFAFDAESLMLGGLQLGLIPASKPRGVA